VSSEKKKDEATVNRFWDRLGIPVCSLNEARQVIETAFDVRPPMVACMIGEAGIGKSQIWRQIGEDRKTDVVYFFLAHLEREDIGGIPFPSPDGNSYKFLCENTIKEVIDSGRPTIVVLDEWNRGEKATMNAAFTLMEDRRFGSYRLPDHVFIGAAMNPSEGNYLVNEAEKDPAFRRRLVMLAVQSNAAAFLEHARHRGKFHHLVCDYIEAQPQMLSDTNAREAGKVYANPAGWEKISNVLFALEKQNRDLMVSERMMNIMGAGIIGMGPMSQFMGYVKENATVINPEDIFTNYAKKARSKVQKLVKGGRNDAFTEVCESLALSIVTRRNEPEVKDDLPKVARNVGEFLNDLPSEGIMGFLSKLGKHAQDAGQDGAKFHMDISDELSQAPAYQQAIDKIGMAQDKVEEERESSKKEKKSK